LDDLDRFRTEFNRADPANLGPWLSVNQALAWVATRVGSFTEFVGHLETRNDLEHRELTAQVNAEALAENSDEGRQFLKDYASIEMWPGGSVFAHAGRALLKQVLAGAITPSALEKGIGRKMERHEFAALGRQQTAYEWLDLRPAPMFDVRELTSTFPVPTRENPKSPGRSTARAERECATWLIEQFGADPAKARPKESFWGDAHIRFGGRLSRRGFTRVWDGLADEHGRNKAGAKPKSSR
jgi:hypothetical protein